VPPRLVRTPLSRGPPFCSGHGRLVRKTSAHRAIPSCSPRRLGRGPASGTGRLAPLGVRGARRALVFLPEPFRSTGRVPSPSSRCP
jgi:hypothetical protein